MNIVPAWIPANPLLLVVGQSPGRVEYERGRPFVGPAGQQMREWIEMVGLDPDEDVAYTNVHNEYHPRDPNHKPTPKEEKEGYERVKGELDALPTVRVVLLVGGTAAHMLFSGRMGQMHGREGRIGEETINPDLSSEPSPTSVPALACWHPSFYIRKKSYKARAEIEGDVLDVLRRTVAIIRGKKEELKLPEPEYVDAVVVT